tara:strand:- start:193 stop:429 length:237 start_codon:yes stop_codon:yes gene_type:complete
MNGKGDKWRGGWSKTYENNHKKIFGDKMKDKNEKQKYVFVSDKHDELKIKWDTGWQYFEFVVNVDMLIDLMPYDEVEG